MLKLSLKKNLTFFFRSLVNFVFILIFAKQYKLQNKNFTIKYKLILT